MCAHRYSRQRYIIIITFLVLLLQENNLENKAPQCPYCLSTAFITSDYDDDYEPLYTYLTCEKCRVRSSVQKGDFSDSLNYQWPLISVHLIDYHRRISEIEKELSAKIEQIEIKMQSIDDIIERLEELLMKAGRYHAEIRAYFESGAFKEVMLQELQEKLSKKFTQDFVMKFIEVSKASDY